MKKILLALFFVASAHAADYHVGPGQTYDDINDIAMHNLVAGDTVHIHWRSTPYREKFRLSGVGTAAQPIRVIGVPGPSGQRPVISGENATSHPGDVWGTWGNNNSTGDVGIIIIHRGPGRPYEEKPSFIQIEGLEITKARYLYNYTTAEGNTRQFGGAAIWMIGANDVSIINCKLHDCADGLFAKSADDEPNATRRLLVKKCHIENNSENLQQSGQNFASHNVYTECFGVTFEENYFGPTRPNSDGGNLKDRSSGTVIRYNWVEGGLRLLDLVEAQDSWPLVQQEIATGNLSYRSTQVYGNILYSGPGQAIRACHYGGDSGNENSYRKGNLYFHHNTIVYHRDQSEFYRVAVFDLSTDDETAEIWNNIFYMEPATTGATPALLYLGFQYGNHNFGPNWANSGFGTWDNGLPPAGSGTMNGVSNIISGSDPGFKNPAVKNYRLRYNAPVINQGGTLPANAHAVSLQYVSHQNSEPRPSSGAADLGAYEFLPPVTNVAPEALAQSVYYIENSTITITLVGYDENNDYLTFSIGGIPFNGTLGSIIPSGSTTATITYTPYPNYSGPDSFTYQVSDGVFTSAPATISLSVNPPTNTLTVQGGSGSGNYLAGQIITITANTPPTGQAFTAWAGGTVADPLATTTTITMPATAVTVAALFRPIPPPGGPFTYDVGPDQPYLTLSAIPWTSLFPGDTVRLHWRPTSYAEKVLIPARGTATAPIRLIGIPSPTGELPIISGLNAVTGPNTAFASWDVNQYLGLLTIARADTDSAYFKPGFIEISNLELTDVAATPNIWLEGAAAIRLDGAENISITNCHIHHTCTGISARLNNGNEFGLTRDLRIERSYLHDIGTSGQYGNANINTEVAGITIKYCRLDAPITGSFGDNLLDRSAGTHIESCRITGASRLLELAGPVSNGATLITGDPRFTTTKLIGNLITNTHNQCTQPIYAGADSGDPTYPRTGNFLMHHNTILNSNGTYQVNVPSVHDNITVDFRHNIIHRTGSELIQLMSGNGTLHSGINWITTGYTLSPTAYITGTAAIITGASPLLDANSVPTATSPCRDTAASLLTATQYAEIASGHIRIITGTAADLGAFEFNLSPPGSTASLTGNATNGNFQLTLTATANAPYLIQSSTDLTNWTTLTTLQTNPSGTATLTDPITTPKKFYRAQW